MPQRVLREWAIRSYVTGVAVLVLFIDGAGSLWDWYCLSTWHPTASKSRPC